MVSEFRHLKVKERQINKFNRLVQKEGNITWSSAPPGGSAALFPGQTVLAPSQEEAQTAQVLIPRQVVLFPRQLACDLDQSLLYRFSQ